MSEQEEVKSIFDNSSTKFNFIFGFVSGVACMSVLLFVVLVIMFWSGSRTFGQPVANTNAQNTVQIQQPPVDNGLQDPVNNAPVNVRAIDNTDHVKGPKDAKVELIEYSDFECPFCGTFAKTVKQIEAEYGSKIKIAYRHFPLSFHPNAGKAGEASECASEQGKFWEMHDKIFEAQSTPNFNIDGWKKIATQLGLNSKKFNECLDSGKMASKVQAGLNEGSAMGITGTPTSYINGVPLQGALPYAQVKAIIDSQLNK